MATILNRSVSRRTRDAYRVLYAGKAREVVVTLRPGDVIEFRESRGRAKFSVSIEGAFKYAVRIDAARKAQEKKDKRKKTK